jgi:putative RNA 2'-phosphotransferase
LSYVLRHKPDSIGIQLDEQGWTEIALILEKLNISKSELVYVVSNNAKQRFSISDNKIRANQGHSVKVNLGLTSKQPPIKLYHGTTTKNYERIKIDGLLKMNRNHVHLSEDFETAKQVGSRHGKPIILKIDCEQMVKEEIQFFLSENGVWLTEYVNPKFISKYNGQ